MDPFRKVYYTLQSVANHPLNRRSTWKAVRNFCVAQVAVRLVPGDACVAFPNQTRLLISPRMKGAAHFISPGLCEFDEMCFVAHFLRPGDLFADVGANVGAYTVLASGVAGAKTVACEPSPSTFGYLALNVRLNDLSEKVTALNVALGSKEGTLRLTENLGTENHVCREGTGSDGVDIKATTLDMVFADSTPALIKMDVEGFETEVFAGANRTLAQPALQAMIVERGAVASRYGYNEDALHERIRASSFIPCAYSAMRRQLSKIPPESTGNIIYVRNFEFAQDKLRTAPSFSFAGVQI
jgi:FkbM family methyltransferase